MKDVLFDELQKACDEAYKAIGNSDAAKESAAARLIELRNKKTTWVFSDENSLRFKIDGVLDQIAPGWRLK